MSWWTWGLVGTAMLLACGQVEPYGKNDGADDELDAGGGADTDGGGTDGPDHGCPERSLDDRLELVGPEASLEEVEGVTRVESLVIEGTAVESLAFLHCLETVAGELTLRANTDLLSLHGLENLKHAGQLRIVDNPRLPNLTGLPLHASFDAVYIVGNAALANLSGLPTGPVSEVELRDNPSLVEVCALTSATDVTTLTLADLPALESMGCLLAANDWFRTDAANGPRSLTIRGNPALLSVTGVPRSNTTLDVVLIQENDSLLDLHGLHFLEEVQVFELSDNPRLAALAHVDPGRLGQLACVESLTVLRNSALTGCEIERFVTNLRLECADLVVEQGGNRPDECG